ncbi:MAG: CBS domain-containing protein [Myxococcota bacterium]
MTVSEIMTPDPLTVGREDTLLNALDLMVQNGIHELPVMDGSSLVGIITERDLRSALGKGVRTVDERVMDEARLEAAVGDWMATDVEAIYPETTISEAARLLAMLRVGSLPVVDGEEQLVGILSVTDLLVYIAERLEAE